MMEWLLKYPIEWYADGRLVIGWPWWLYATTLAALLAALVYVARYRFIGASAGPFAARAMILALLLWLLAEPGLATRVPRTVAGHVAVLVDDSLSMRLGETGASRAAVAARLLAPDDGSSKGSLAAELEKRFDTRYFAFGEGLRELDSPPIPGFSQSRSELGAALEAIAVGRGGHPAAVVLISDGVVEADGDGRRLDAALLGLRAAGVPVHAVMPGAAEASPDLELRRLRLPDRILVGDRMQAEIEIRHRGLDGVRATVILEEDGLLVDRLELALDGDGSTVVRRSLQFDQAGPRLLTARVESPVAEAIAENNTLERSVAVDAGPLRVLHVEGEPRFEVKFLRRALRDDPAIRLTSLVRTADNKYYRAGIDSLDQLADGFPSSAEELFGFDVLVLGSVPADLLDRSQWAAVREFVSRRGGGLVLLGGRWAFAEGGHRDTVVEELSPVGLEAPHPGFRAEVRVAAGQVSGHDGGGVLPLSSDETLSALLARMPPLEMLNPVRVARPGARVLLRGEDADGPLVVLATQRHGRGRVTGFAVSNSWRWQLHSSVPVDDSTHELLWRRLLRESGRHAGDRVRILQRQLASTPGTPVTVKALGLSSEYMPLFDAELYLQSVSPSGLVERRQLSGSDAEGYRSATLLPRESGRYELTVELRDSGGVVAAEHAVVDVDASGGEFRRADIDRGSLQRIADSTGGSLWRDDDTAELPDRLLTARGGVREQTVLPLVDVPLVLGLLIVLLGLEWFWRRAGKLR